MYKGLFVNYTKRVLALMLVLFSSCMQASDANLFKLCGMAQFAGIIGYNIVNSRSRTACYAMYLETKQEHNILERYDKNASHEALYNLSCGLFAGAILGAGYEYATGCTGLSYVPEALFVGGALSSFCYCSQNSEAKNIAITEYLNKITKKSFSRSDFYSSRDLDFEQRSNEKVQILPIALKSFEKLKQE